jgi:RNA polymerase sigma-70 factor (ECF subfamily)
MAEPSPALQTRASLLVRLRDPRDAASWQTFVAVYGPLVYGHCRRRGLQHDDAQDVSQTVFAPVAQSLRTFQYRPEAGRFRDWLGAAVRNEVNRFFKKQARQARGQGGGEEDEAVLDQAVARAEDNAWTEEFNARVLRCALERSRPHFEEPTWRAFEAVWLENRPALEVARELGRPIDWVYMAKSRVLKDLWQQVQELADDAALPAALAR